MVLDECPPSGAARARVEAAMQRTHRWARRCVDVGDPGQRNRRKRTIDVRREPRTADHKDGIALAVQLSDAFGSWADRHEGRQAGAEGEGGGVLRRIELHHPVDRRRRGA